MNRFLADTWQERVHRLALGLEPVDVGTRTRVSNGVEVVLESFPDPPTAWRRFVPGADLNTFMRRFDRHSTSRYVLRYTSTTTSPILVRLFDGVRKFVPRRLSLGIPTLSQVEAPESDPTRPIVPTWRRVVRPGLYPGSAYHMNLRSTALRGRVLRAGKPMRWARIEAVSAGTGDPLGWAHGDDRGEFLLIVQLKQSPGQVWNPADPLQVEVSVFGPKPQPVPTASATVDPLWDLPLEIVPILAPGTTNPGEAGRELPSGYVRSTSSPTVVPLPLGRIASAATGLPTFEFTT